MPNYLYQTPPEKVGIAGKGLADKLLQFYLENQNDIDAILNYPGNPTGYVDDAIRAVYKAAPAAAVVVNPNTAQKLFEKTLKMYKELEQTGRAFNNLPGILKHRANIAAAYVAAKYPRLFSKINRLQATSLGRGAENVIATYKAESALAGDPEIYLNTDALLNRPNISTEDIIRALSHEMTHMAYDSRVSPAMHYIDVPASGDTVVAYAHHPGEIVARRAESDAAMSRLLQRAILKNLKTNDNPEEIISNIAAARRIVGSLPGRVISPSEAISLKHLQMFSDYIAQRLGSDPHIYPRYRISPSIWSDIVGERLRVLTSRYDDRRIMREHAVIDDVIQRLADRIIQGGYVTRPEVREIQRIYGRRR